jgi:hypothetical protein
VPGVSTAIIGTGKISDNSRECQILQNLSAAQIHHGALSESDRLAIEARTSAIKSGRTNWFQQDFIGLTPPANPRLKPVQSDRPALALYWETALAGSQPIDYYEICRNETTLSRIPYSPQLSQDPFSWIDQNPLPGNSTYRIVTIDRNGNRARSRKLTYHRRP